MNKVLLLAIGLACTISSGAQVRSFQDLTGKWEIVGEEMPNASLEIIDSANIYLTYGGERKKVSSVVLNTRKSPAWLDFSITDSTGVLEVKTLVHLYGEGILKWQLFIEEERPEYFSSSKGELMYLKKVPVRAVARGNR